MMTASRVVVCGEPGSGKTTYVRRFAKPGDIVWDMDAIAVALGFEKTFPYPQDILQIMLAWRKSLLESIALRKRRMFIIVTDKESAERVARKIGAALVNVEDIPRETI